ncbi:MAG: phage tail tape measure protein [Lachnospiraceae bacterium]|nr:phage tail tape measure protein [Lachnospiraceae bacterium]
MSQEDISTRWKIDISELKAGMQEAKRSITTANAEFKKATSGMDKWAMSADGLTAKLTQLKTTIVQQKAILENLQNQYKLVTQAEGENSAGAEKLKTQILNQEAAVGRAELQFKKYDSQLEKVNASTKEAESTMGKLKSTITEQDAKLGSLAKEYANLVLEQKGGTKEAKDLKKEMEDLSSELNTNKKKLNDAETATKSLTREVDDLGDKSGTTTKQLSDIKGALNFGNAMQAGQILVDVAEKVVDAGKLLTDAWGEVDDGLDTITTKTGATGEVAAGLQSVFEGVVKSIPVESLDVAGQAVGELNIQFGFTGDRLQTATEYLLKFAEINKTDVTTSAQNAKSAMAAFGLSNEELEGTLDSVTKVSQDTGVGVDSLFESVTSGAPQIKALGLSLAGGATLMGNFEKSGVDGASALTSLSKASVTYAKDGKTLSRGLEETQAAILGAKDNTEALNIASEVFGTKGAVRMTEAIQRGTLDLGSLSTAASEASGTVGKTFEAIQDPKDKFTVALQSAKLEMADAGGKIYETALDTFNKIDSEIDVDKTMEKASEAVGDFVEDLGDAAVWAVNHAEEIATGLKVVGGAMAAAFAINKTAQLTRSIGTLAKAFKLVTVATGEQTIAQSALNVVMNANPIGIAAIALGGLAIAAQKENEERKENIATIAELNPAEQELSDRINEQADSYKTMMDARNEAMSGITAETANTQNLVNELRTLVDENGNVKDGNQERANVITGILSQALGIELDATSGVIANYGELNATMDETIQLQKTKALMSAMEGDYADAIANQTTNYTDLANAQKNLESTSNELSSAQAELNRLEEENNNGMNLSIPEMKAYADKHTALKNEIEGLTDKQKGQTETLNKADEAYATTMTTIANYEGLIGAAASGSATQVEDANNRAASSFITAETGTKASLDNQVKNMADNYVQIKAQMDAGAPGVTQAAVDHAKEMADGANIEYARFVAMSGPQGAAAGASFASGLGSKSYETALRAAEIASGVKGAFNINLYGNGASAIQTFIAGIQSKKISVATTTSSDMMKLNLSVAAQANGSVLKFADGGVMTKPTFFGEIGHKTLLGGEAGVDEAVIPLRKSVLEKIGGGIISSLSNRMLSSGLAEFTKNIVEQVKETAAGMIDTSKTNSMYALPSSLEVARTVASSSANDIANTNKNIVNNYYQAEQSAKEIAITIENTVSGDVYLDNEKTGKILAPYITKAQDRTNTISARMEGRR